MMIHLDKLRAVKKVITHASCPDGIASALIIKDALPNVEVVFMSHGTEEHRRLEPQPGVLFCDFTPAVGWADGSGSHTQAWIENGAIVLDHHPTQRDLTMRFVEAGLGAYGENDRNECGAWLAFKNVWLPLNNYESSDRADHVFQFAELAGVRDTWKKDDPRWELACEQAEMLMFWGFDDLCKMGFYGVDRNQISLGHKLFEKKLESARKAIDESCRFTTAKGTRVLMFQGVTPTSDAAELLEKLDAIESLEWADHPTETFHQTEIVAGFHYRVDAGRLQLQFSTRSHTGYDVGAFCKSHGGGGHKAAAGFTVEGAGRLSNPYEVFSELLNDWEQGK